jgi:hypothetical protein
MLAARLNDIVDALELQFDQSSSFLDRDTGQVETVSDVLLREAERSPATTRSLIFLRVRHPDV